MSEAWRIALESKTKPADMDRLKEVIRLLKLAIDDCEKLLDEAEQQVRLTGQDNQRNSN